MSARLTRTLILYAHGSRDPQWCKPLEAIRERIAQTTPHVRVEIAYLELQPPTLDEVIARVAADAAGASCLVQVMPMFLGQGGHLRRDVAERVASVAAAHPTVQIAPLPSLGETGTLLEAIADSIAARVANG